jgi:hypothetical protein
MDNKTLSPEQCQKHAATCREMARQETNPQTLKSLEDLATSWELCEEICKTAQSKVGEPPQAQAMKKLAEYLQHAAECREMARVAQPTHRLQLEQMAETWEQLAKARKRKMEKQGNGNDDGDE